MNISEQLTVVIPCKNEKETILFTLKLLNEQSNVSNLRVIISDSSDDNTRNLILQNTYKNLSIEIINGGFPSIARNNGAVLSETPYILFLDADMFLQDKTTIKDAISLICDNTFDLVTAKFRTKGKYFYVFPIFEFFRNWFIEHSVCAVGGFMLFNRDTFFEVGGFDPKHLFAEDYALSSKIHHEKFGILNKKIYTTDRRFRKKGLFYMIKMAILSTINVNNSKFFEKDHDYWK